MLSDRLLPVNKIWGIHIWELQNEEYLINAVLVENCKGILQIQKSLVLHDLNQLTIEYFETIPVCISFDSKNVLIREIQHDEDNQMLYSQLHINNVDDFKVQVIALVENNIAYVIRNQLLIEVITRLSERLQIINFYLGPISFRSCLPFIESETKDQIIEFFNYSVFVSPRGIEKIIRKSAITNEESSIQIGNENILSGFVIPYCNALNFFLKNVDTSWLLNSVFSSNSDEFYYKRLFKVLAPVCFGFLLILLVGNFLLLKNYTNNQRILRGEYAYYQKIYSELQELRVRFEKQKVLTGQLSATDYGYFTFYADRIVAMIQNRVNLTSMVFHPYVEKQDENLKIITFSEGVVEIRGTCDSPTPLNSWLDDLGRLSFIKSIYDQNYIYDDFEKAGTFFFRLKVAQDGME
jgi:hypothetical protein